MKLNYINDDGGRSKYFAANNVGDCVTRAIAIATQRDYKEVYDEISQFLGYTPRNGVKHNDTKRVMDHLGFEWHSTMGIGTGCQVHLAQGEVPMDQPIVCNCSGYLVAVINGNLRDTYDSSRDGTRCVYGYWTLGTAKVGSKAQETQKEDDINISNGGKYTLDDIMRKIRKLKSLYEGAKKINSEGEAHMAALLMKKLLTQYNLTMEQVGDAEDKEKDKILDEVVSGYSYHSIGGQWESYLTYVICKWNFCRMLQWGGYKKLIIIGNRENLEMVKWLRDTLADRYVQFSKDRYKEYCESEYGMIHPMSKDKYQRSYLMGCAQGLDVKLTKEHEQEKKEDEEYSAKVTALVLRKDAELEKYCDDKWHPKKGRQMHVHYDAANAAGFKDGKNTQLNKPISSQKSAASNVKLLK